MQHLSEDPLITAARQGDIRQLKAATKETILRVKDTEGFTAIHWAAQRGKKEAVEILVDKLDETTIDLPNNRGDTPYMLAAKWGHAEVMKVIAKKKAKIDKINLDGESAFTLAATAENDAALRYLAERKKDVKRDHVNHRGETALHRAAFEDRFQNVKFLVEEAHLKIDATNQLGDTPLAVAAARGNVKIVDYLLERGASITAPNEGANSAIFLASIWGHTEVAKRLLQQTTISLQKIKNSNGYTPVELAEINNNRELVEFFKSRGCSATDPVRIKQAQQSLQQRFEEGQRYFQQKKYDEAARCFMEVMHNGVKLHREVTDKYFESKRLARLSHSPSVGKEVAREQAAASPSPPMSPQGSSRSSRSATADASQEISIIVGNVQDAIDAGDYNSALQHCEKAMRFDVVRGFICIAKVNEAQKNIEQARFYYQAALNEAFTTLDPQNRKIAQRKLESLPKIVAPSLPVKPDPSGTIMNREAWQAQLQAAKLQLEEAAQREKNLRGAIQEQESEKQNLLRQLQSLSQRSTHFEKEVGLLQAELTAKLKKIEVDESFLNEQKDRLAKWEDLLAEKDAQLETLLQEIQSQNQNGGDVAKKVPAQQEVTTLREQLEQEKQEYKNQQEQVAQQLEGLQQEKSMLQEANSRLQETVTSRRQMMAEQTMQLQPVGPSVASSKPSPVIPSVAPVGPLFLKPGGPKPIAQPKGAMPTNLPKP